MKSRSGSGDILKFKEVKQIRDVAAVGKGESNL